MTVKVERAGKGWDAFGARVDGMQLSPAVCRLRARLESEFVRMPQGHKLVCPEEQKIYAELAGESYSASVGKPEILRRAAFLALFAERFPVVIRDDERIVGSQRFTQPPWQQILGEERLAVCGVHANHGHIVVDYGRVLNLGIPGLQAAVNAMPESDNRAAFAQTLGAFATFMRRHGCAGLADGAPRSFHDALQMVWFTQIFLSAEGNASAVSFGRFDQYLWPFLQRDLESGRLGPDEAYERLCCFLMKCCEGGESQNLTVGGNSEENLLSLLVLRAMRDLKIWQPSISARIGPGTTEAFWQEALRLCDTGIGMPSFFNDAVVTAALRKLDIPPRRAADWGIVGCYEASPQGDACPYTVGGGFALPDLLWDYLQTSPAPDSFDAFKRDFKAYFSGAYKDRILPGFEERRLALQARCASPFESLCVTGCIESGLAVEEGGARFNLFGVNILGIGTLVDSLLSIRKLVFEAQAFTLAAMTRAVAENFPDRKLLLRCRALPGKFGSDSPDSNDLAREFSTFIAAEVLASSLGNGVRPYPGFFWFGRDIGRGCAASPDGRLAQDRLSYGCGPGVLLEKPSTTSVLNSAACIDHASCACGNPLTVSFNRQDLKDAAGRALMRRVVESYFSKGGFHLHINIVDVQDLQEAKAHPERHNDLTVRISGFSARFVSLGEGWQDAIIERTAKGM